MPYGVARALGENTADAAFSALIEALSDAAAVLDANGAIAVINSRFAALVDADNDALTGRFFADVLRPVESAQLASQLQGSLTEGTSSRGNYRLAGPGQGSVTLEISFEPLAAQAGPGALLARMQQIGASVESVDAAPGDRAELDLAERRYRQLALSAGDLVTLHAPDRSLLGWWSNGSFPAGTSASIGEQLNVVTHADDAVTLNDAWSAAVEGDEPVTVSYRIERTPGVWAWVESKIEAVRDASGTLVELQMVSRDITEQRSFQHELARLALRDPLTGLANRLLFGDRLRAAVARLDRGRGPIAVLLLDVDRFKGVNDSLGHTAGDRLLVELGERLSASVRASDTVARLSGDEFAVLAEDLESPEAADALAERALAELQLPYELEGGFTLTVTPSIGVTISADPATTPDDLIREADAALYAAKAGGRNRLAVFDAPLRQEVHHRQGIDQQVRRAFAADDLRCEYQPTVDLHDGVVIMAEALVRLGDGRGGILMPRQFLSVCEDTGLVLELDRRVIATVLREIAGIRSGAAGRCPVVSINLSSRSLTDPRFADMVAELLDEHGLEGGGLAFELTEPTLPVGGSGLDRTVSALAEMGIGIGLDNFGTGSSALSTLTTLEIDFVKIDGTFLATAAAGPVGMSVNRAVIDLARALGLAVIGQGVERPEQLTLLTQLGCTLAQGYVLARPMPLADIAPTLQVPVTR